MQSESDRDSGPDDIVVDEADGSAGSNRPCRAGKRHGRTRAVPSGTSHARGSSSAQDEEPLEDPVGDSSSGSEAERPPECVLCQKSIANPAELSTSGTSRATFHRDCLNAQLYFERHARSRIGSAALNKYTVEKRREFRYKVLELLTMNAISGSGGSGRRRGAQDRSRIVDPSSCWANAPFCSGAAQLSRSCRLGQDRQRRTAFVTLRGQGRNECTALRWGRQWIPFFLFRPACLRNMETSVNAGVDSMVGSAWV